MLPSKPVYKKEKRGVEGKGRKGKRRKGKRREQAL